MILFSQRFQEAGRSVLLFGWWGDAESISCRRLLVRSRNRNQVLKLGVLHEDQNCLCTSPLLRSDVSVLPRQLGSVCAAWFCFHHLWNVVASWGLENRLMGWCGAISHTEVPGCHLPVCLTQRPLPVFKWGCCSSGQARCSSAGGAEVSGSSPPWCK